MISYCPSCGAEAREGARFCHQCGAALHPETAPEPAPVTATAGPPPTLAVPPPLTAPVPPYSEVPPYPQYPPPPYPIVPGVRELRRSNMAMAGFIVGLATVVIGILLTWLGTIMGICGLVFSLIGLSETGPRAQLAGGPKTGRGLAIAGVILSIIGIIGSVLLLIYILRNAEQFGIQLPPSLRP